MTYIPDWGAIEVMVSNLNASYTRTADGMHICFDLLGDARDFPDSEQGRRDAIRWLHAEIKFMESLEAQRTRQRPVVPKFS